MTEAQTIALALEGKRGRYGYRCRCPLPSHGQGRGDHSRSLSVRDGHTRVLFRCYAGCRSEDIAAEVLRRGLFDKGGVTTSGVTERVHHDRGEIVEADAEALDLWRRARPATGTLIETRYLRPIRGITIAPPPSLRYAELPYDYRVTLPAMVAGIQAPDRRLIGVQVTWLDRRTYRRDRRGNVGPLGTGAVRLAAAGDVLGLSEGVETGLSAMQIHGVPVWAVLGDRMHVVTIPDSVRKLILFGDNGSPGHEFVARATQHHARDGREVVPCFPPEAFGDWADVTAAQGA